MSDTATTTNTLSSIVAAPKSSFLDEYERQQALKKANGTATTTVAQDNYATAQNRLASIASGTPSAAVQAAQQASRESLARQANNQRSQNAQNIAASGMLGQGAAAQSTAATEANIAKGIADSRLAERQAIGQEANDANKELITNAQADRSAQQTASNQNQSVLQTLLTSGNAAQQLQAQAGLSSLAGITPGENSDEINQKAYNEAINDPKYKADQSAAKLADITAQDQLKTKQNEIAYKTYASKAVKTVTSGKLSDNLDGVQPGDIVMYKDTPYVFVSYDSKNGVSTFKNPETGEIYTETVDSRGSGSSNPIVNWWNSL